MRLWCLHVDHCSFAATQPRADVDAAAIEDAPVENPEDPETAASGEGGIGAGVLALVGVSEDDETRVKRGGTTASALATAASEEIDDASATLGGSAVAVIPAPALAPTPAAGDLAAAVCQHLDSEVADIGSEVTDLDSPDREYVRAPVGWHLAVDLSARGHPVASRIRNLTRTHAAAASDWGVIGADGSITDADEVDVSTTFERFLDRRRGGALDGEGDDAARDAGLVAGETAMLTPAGALVRDLLGDHLDARLRAAGARQVGTLSASAGAAGPFEAAAPGADDLPASLYAMDGSGPAVWTAVGSYESALDTVETGVALLGRWLADATLDFVPVLTVPSDETISRERMQTLADLFDAPVLLERGGETATFGVELIVTDATGHPLATGRVRLLDAQGAGDAVSHVVHATLDDLERFTVALCHPAGTDRRLPTWLAPTQVRLLALDPSAHSARCQDLAAELADRGIRVDVDDRPLAVGERFERAAAAGVPYVAVVGDRERSGETIPVTDRGSRAERQWTVAALAAAVDGACDGYPRAESREPRLCSEQLFSAGDPGEE